MPTGIYNHKSNYVLTPKRLEHIRKIGFKKGNTINIGRKYSEESIKKMSKNSAKIWLGKKRSGKVRKKMSENSARYWLGKRDKDTANWKGDNVGYWGIHKWVKKHKGKPKICEHCGATNKERKLYWANIDHQYRRKLDDYISLCNPCHKKYDKEYNGSKVGRKLKI